MVPEGVHCAAGVEGTEGLHRIRGRAPGCRGLSERAAPRRQQDRVHAVRLRSHPAPEDRRVQRAGRHGRQRVHEGPVRSATEAELAKRTGNTAAAAPLTSQANPNLTQVQGEVNKIIPDRLDDLQADQIPWNNPHRHPAHGGLYRNVRLTSPIRCTFRCRSTASSRPQARTPTRRTSRPLRPASPSKCPCRTTAPPRSSSSCVRP